MFLIKSFGDEVEKTEVAELIFDQAKETKNEKKRLKERTSSRDRALINRAERDLRKASDEFNRCKNELKMAKNAATKASKRTNENDVNETLLKAEKSYRKGKRIGTETDIFDDNLSWTPKDMKYGMNYS